MNTIISRHCNYDIARIAAAEYSKQTNFGVDVIKYYQDIDFDSERFLCRYQDGKCIEVSLSNKYRD